MKNTTQSFYATFGQSHTHVVKEKIFDKDCVCRIFAKNEDDARGKIIELFGTKWSFMYNKIHLVGLHYYPRGIVDL